MKENKKGQSVPARKGKQHGFLLEDVGKDGREDSGGSRGEEEEAEQEEDTVSGDTRTKRDSNYEPAASVM